MPSQEAQASSGVAIRSVIVGIAGDHIQSFQSRGVVGISGQDHEVTRADIDRLIEDTKRVALPSDRKIIHVIPQEFIIDGQDGIYDPLGMSGVRMEANVHIITGLVSAAQNIYKCVQRAGLEISDMVLEPLASSYAVLDDEEKEVGIALLDIGGGTTDLAVFEERTIRHTAVIGIAGRKVTDDIRKGLGILNEQAERLKKDHGCAYVNAVVDNEPLVLPGVGGRPPIEIDKHILAQIIQPRMEEILEIAALEIKRSGYAKHLAGGVVLTGGGALIKGTAELAQRSARHAGEDRHPGRLLRRTRPRDREPGVRNGGRPHLSWSEAQTVDDDGRQRAAVRPQGKQARSVASSAQGESLVRSARRALNHQYKIQRELIITKEVLL